MYQSEIARLTAECEEQSERADWAIEKANNWRERAEKAEALIAQVRELAEFRDAQEGFGYRGIPQDLLALLDGAK